MSIFSNNLKSLRAEKSLTQKQLSFDLIITRDCLSAYETGRNEPPFETLIRISDYFNKSIDALIKRNLTLKPKPRS